MLIWSFVSKLDRHICNLQTRYTIYLLKLVQVPKLFQDIRALTSKYWANENHQSSNLHKSVIYLDNISFFRYILSSTNYFDEIKHTIYRILYMAKFWFPHFCCETDTLLQLLQPPHISNFFFTYLYTHNTCLQKPLIYVVESFCIQRGIIHRLTKLMCFLNYISYF